MATDTSVIKDLLISKFATPLASNLTASTEIGKLFTDVYEIRKITADTTGTDTTAATAIPPTAGMYAGVVKACFLNSSAAITASATHYATLTLKAYPAAGVTGTTIATYVTTTGVTAFARTAMTLATTASNLAIVAGANFTLEIAKSGSGYTLPVLASQIFVERTG